MSGLDSLPLSNVRCARCKKPDPLMRHHKDGCDMASFVDEMNALCWLPVGDGCCLLPADHQGDCTTAKGEG